MKLRREPRKKRLPKINWGPTQTFPHGSRYWDSADGMLRKVASEVYDGIILPREWKLYRWKRASWCPIGEYKSQRRIERLAQETMQRLEEN